MLTPKEMSGSGPTKGKVYPHKIEYSALFDSGDFLAWTPSTSGNRQVWTWDGPIRKVQSGFHVLASARQGASNQTYFGFNGSDQFFYYSVTGGAVDCNIVSTAKFIDITGYLHLSIAVDTTDATAANRVRIWINGIQITEFVTNTTYSQNANTWFNHTVEHQVCASAGTGYKFRLSPVRFVEGQALPASTFGEFSDLVAGLWIPKKYTGSYGTNGRLYEFKNAADLGADTSGNNNHATVSGSPVQVLGGTNVYATLNPLNLTAAAYPPTFSNGNLTVENGNYIYGPYLPNTGKWQWESTLNAHATANNTVGIVSKTMKRNNLDPWVADDIKRHTLAAGDVGVVFSHLFDADAGTYEIKRDNVQVANFTGLTANDWVVVTTGIGGDIRTFNFGATGFTHAQVGFKALCTDNLPKPDLMNSEEYAQIIERVGDGGCVHPRNFTSNTNGEWTVSADYSYPGYHPYYAVNGSLASRWSTNNAPWASAWWKAACTTKQYVDAFSFDCYQTLYPKSFEFQGSDDGVTWDTLATFTNHAGETLTHELATRAYYKEYRFYLTAANQDNTVQFEDVQLLRRKAKVLTPIMENGPDLVISKILNGTDPHWSWFDRIRGNGKVVQSDTTNVQLDWDALDFESDGYVVKTSLNTGNSSYQDTCLKQGNGFEIVTFSKTTTGAQSFAHGLGKAPTFMIICPLNVSARKQVYHKALGATKFIDLTSSGAAVTEAGAWDNTEPTATHFTLGSTWGTYNFVAYLFTDSDLYEAFSFKGNANVVGPYFDIDGEPLAILFGKNASIASTDWFHFNAVSNPFNPVGKGLVPNMPSIENDWCRLAFTSRGVKVNENNATVNGNGNLIVGLAIKKSTSKYCNAF